MLKRLKLLREAWKLTKTLDGGVSVTSPKGETLTTEEIKKMLEVDLPLGDGNAEFLGDEMSETEFQEYVHNEENGWGSWLKKKKHVEP